MRLMSDLLQQNRNDNYGIIVINFLIIHPIDDKDHSCLIKPVLDTTPKVAIQLQENKSTFGLTMPQFLGSEFDRENAWIRMAHEKFKVNTDWPGPETPLNMGYFVGIPGVYSHIVADIASICTPIVSHCSIHWRTFRVCCVYSNPWAGVTKATDFLKAAMLCLPEIALPEIGNYDYLVRPDASDFAIAAILW